jgi:hypothetical protein
MSVVELLSLIEQVELFTIDGKRIFQPILAGVVSILTVMER